MTKRKHLSGGLLTVLQGVSMTIMVGSMKEGRHDAAAIAEGLYLVYKQKAEGEGDWSWPRLLKP